MRYPQSNAESAELLRLSLPLMSRHAEGYHPVSYAIWYEYVAGTNTALQQQLDPAVEKGLRLSEAQTYQVYQNCILDSWGAQALKVNAGLSDLIEDFASSTEQVDERLGSFEQSLASFNLTLDGDGGGDGGLGVSAVSAASLRKEGMLLQQGIATLQGELHSGRDQVRHLQALLKQLENDVMTDPLTGLYNRRGLSQAYLRYCDGAQRLLEHCSVVMLDIDHFKNINDTFGHLFGDQVIRGVAGALRNHANPLDLVARYGGEEFVLILPGTSVQEARTTAEKMRAHIASSVVRRRGSQDVATRVTVSAGVTGSGVNDTLDSLLGRADTALYMAKNQGRNQVALLM